MGEEGELSDKFKEVCIYVHILKDNMNNFSFSDRSSSLSISTSRAVKNPSSRRTDNDTYENAKKWTENDLSQLNHRLLCAQLKAKSAETRFHSLIESIRKHLEMKDVSNGNYNRISGNTASRNFGVNLSTTTRLSIDCQREYDMLYGDAAEVANGQHIADVVVEVEESAEVSEAPKVLVTSDY